MQAVQDAVELALQQADLASADVRRRPADKLSGGMRRRLSVVSHRPARFSNSGRCFEVL